MQPSIERSKTNLSGRGVQHQPGKPILSVDQLTVDYEGRIALKDVSFQLELGERVAVVGPNGAGKSTLFKVISGVLSPARGDLKIFGAVPGKHICIAYVPQRSQVDWSFPVTVADVVMMGRIGKVGFLRWPGRRDWNQVHQSLDEVGLGEMAKRPIDQLSGGQQQRMFIARALAQEAELLLMDEPLTGLDLNSQQSIYSILDDLRRHGVTIMVATHDLDQASERFDKVMLLNQRLLGFGRPGDVFTPEKLMAAYGGHLHLISAENLTLALTDTCCDDEVV